MTQKSVLITGCSEGGIGYYLAKAYAEKGLRVFATARKLSAMQDLASLPNIELFELDVTNAASVRAAREHVEKKTNGTLDILVNNAGASASGPTIEFDIELAKRAFDANVFGVMRMCQEFIDLLIASKGQIANVGSVTAFIPLGFAGVYNASKAALHQYSDSLRIELAPFGVNVTTVVTGTIKTKIWTYDEPLSEKSKYYIMNDQYISKRSGEASSKDGMDPEVYAKWFAEKTTQKNVPGWLYNGSSTTAIWFLDTFLPRQSFLNITSRLYGFDVLAKRLAKS